jgi:hypothetical protein
VTNFNVGLIHFGQFAIQIFLYLLWHLIILKGKTCFKVHFTKSLHLSVAVFSARVPDNLKSKVANQILYIHSYACFMLNCGTLEGFQQEFERLFSTGMHYPLGWTNTRGHFGVQVPPEAAMVEGTFLNKLSSCPLYTQRVMRMSRREIVSVHHSAHFIMRNY